MVRRWCGTRAAREKRKKRKLEPVRVERVRGGAEENAPMRCYVQGSRKEIDGRKKK